MSHKLNSAVAEIGDEIGKDSFDVAGQDKRDEMHSEASSSSQPSIITRDQGRRGRPRVPSVTAIRKVCRRATTSRELCSARFLLSRCPLWVIHVIPAIAACPVRPKSGHSAKARVYEYERAHRSFSDLPVFPSVALARVLRRPAGAP